jgi:hypothetical protein
MSIKQFSAMQDTIGCSTVILKPFLIQPDKPRKKSNLNRTLAEIFQLSASPSFLF